MEIKSKYVEAHVIKKTDEGIKFLLLKRNEKDSFGGIWQMVTGQIKDGEKAYETAIREIKEETNLEVENLWIAPNINSFYSAEADSIIMVPIFIAKVNFDAVEKISREHTDSKWVNAEKAKKMLIWNGQRKSVDAICQYLNYEGDTLLFNQINI